ncbi:MAG TPA: ATP-dependent RNA helicase HrpA [Steroidobacteraceae bacterium]|nr:ATP-dependent RNA helicase HrpA [Steroidobacteraceae bacterium]
MPPPTGLRLEYDPALPITQQRAEIVAAIQSHPVVVVCGATGSGKSTQLPKLCLEAGRAGTGLIGHTQPRRIAARSLAARLAQELGTSVGDAVGYQVRFTDRTGPQSCIKLMTDGILLKELEGDRLLRRYDTLILDEAHERSLNIDLLLGVLQQILPKRPDLRLIVTSATIDPGRFAAFFGGAPIIEVSGRSYPVELRYRPLADEEGSSELSLPEGVVDAVRELDTDPSRPADTLVFLPGEKHIREVAEELERAELQHTEVLPLFARLSTRDQERIFEGHSSRRIILATNVAETSLTVPGIRFVIDSGLARISRYSVRGKVQRLPIERISKASADQRRGRCGREAQGICIRLYSEEDFNQRDDFTTPEVQRTNLASVILRMATLGLGDPESFPFLDRPDTRLVNDGVRLLQELRAMDDERRVTTLGMQIAGLPVDPRLGRMLLAASHLGCVTEMVVIAAFLEAQDPRERPSDAQQQAAQKHAQFTDARSDFVSVLNLWRAFHQQAQAISRNQLRKWCRENYISFLRMREWQDLHAQLAQNVRELKLRFNREPAGYTPLHQAILTGFLGSVGCLDDRREYAGPRGIRFVIAPGTPLAARPPRWVVAGSLVETTRLYARMVAAVDPGWIEGAGAHLLKRTYSEPQWIPSRGFVAAYETVSIYGLTLVARRRVNYGTIAAREAREIFIREALVAGDTPDPSIERAEFLEANRRLIGEVESVEARIRRRDMLVDETALVAFYAARLPERVSSVAAFEHWRARAERSQPGLLHMARSDVEQRPPPPLLANDFPDTLSVGTNQLPLHYRFEPAEADDGVTVTVPESLVGMLSAQELSWLVPGWLLEKITEVLRALPKAQRKQLVPVPDRARLALAQLGREGMRSEGEPRPTASGRGFYEWLASWISTQIGEQVSAAALAALVLPPHLQLNIRVVDAENRVLAEGRDLAALKRKLGPRPAAIAWEPQTPVGQTVASTASLHSQWDFGSLPETSVVERNGLRLTIYPAIVDRGSGVGLVEAHSVIEANALTRGGLVRLALLQLPQQAKLLTRRFADDRELILLSRGIEPRHPLSDTLVRRAFREGLFPDTVPVPRSAEAFAAAVDRGRAELMRVGDELGETVIQILRALRPVRAGLVKLSASPGVLAPALADIAAQVNALLVPDFLEATPVEWLRHFPRYLRAIERRLERLPSNVRRDSELAGKVLPFTRALQSLSADDPARSPAAEQLRWMIEELRVSLFAQDLRTVLRVSEKRLGEQLEAARRERWAQ